jgi:hypothetical protein
LIAGVVVGPAGVLALHIQDVVLRRTAGHRLSAARQDHRGHALWPHLSRQEKINFSQVFAGQAVGIKEVHDDIWLVSFMDHDLGYFD